MISREREVELMQLALDEAAAARDAGDDPYGAVIIRDGAAVTGRNECNTGLDPTAHSEVMAIRNASRQWRTTDLTGAALYTSFEPCPMCCGAIIVSGLRVVVVGARPATPDAVLGEYTFERLLDMAGLRNAFEVRDDVLTSEARAFYARVSAG
jgi:tRNA(adenine34) deaminase